MPGGKQIFLDKSITKNKSEIPFDELLMKSSGEIKSLRSIFILLGLIFFQIFNDLFSDFIGVCYDQFI